MTMGDYETTGGSSMITVSVKTSLMGDVRNPFAPPPPISDLLDQEGLAKAKRLLEAFTGALNSYDSDKFETVRSYVPKLNEALRIRTWGPADQFDHAAKVIGGSSEELHRAVDLHLSGTDMNVVACHLGVEPGSIILTALVVIATGAARAIGEGANAALKSRAEAAVGRGITTMMNQWTTRDPAMAAMHAPDRIEMNTTLRDSPPASTTPAAQAVKATEEKPEAVAVAARRLPFAVAVAGILALLALILVVLVDSNYDLERRNVSTTPPAATTVATTTTSKP